MIRLWARRLLRVTALPIFVLTHGVNASAVLHGVAGHQRLRVRPVPVVQGTYWTEQPCEAVGI